VALNLARELSLRVRASNLRMQASDTSEPKSGSYPDAGNPWTGLGGPMIGAIRSLM